MIDLLSDQATRDSVRFTRRDPETDAWDTRTYGQEDEQFKEELAGYISVDKVLVATPGGLG